MKRRTTAGLALAVALAACSEGVPNPDATLMQTVGNIRVLRAAGEGTVAHSSITSPVDTNNPAAPDPRYEWIVTRSGAPVTRLGDDELRGYDGAFGFEDETQTLWTALDRGTSVELCFRAAQGNDCVYVYPEDRPAEALRSRFVRDLQADGARGEAVLLLQVGTRWESVWIRAGNSALWQPQALPPSTLAPQLMVGSLGARIAWLDGRVLQLWALDEATLTWQPAYAVDDVDRFWAGVPQRLSGGGSRLVVCAGGRPQLLEMSARSLVYTQGPEALDCGALSGQPLLAEDGDGNVMLVWQQDLRHLAAHRDAVTGRWSAPHVFEAGVNPRKLVADLGGHFALLGLDGTASRLRLHVYRPGSGWQAPIAPEPPNVNLEGDVAAYGGRAVVAWARAAGGDDPGTRLAITRIDLATDYGRVEVGIEGAGSVFSAPQGVACPEDCEADLPVGTRLVLEARPADGQRLAGWSGDCPVTFPTSTVVVAAGTTRCTARFEAQTLHTLTLATQGAGSAAADPPGPTYTPGTVVTLTATPAAGQRFVAWGGDIDCADGQLTMSGPRACTAVFEPDPSLAALALTVSGGGRVFSTPAGLDCTGSCQAVFGLGATVVLTAEPPAGASTVWSGACGGSTGLTATVVMSAARQCGVDFQQPAPSGWQALGGALPGGGGLVGRPAIAADAQGVPTVAFLTESADLRELQVLRLVGGGWQRVGGAPLNDPLVSANDPSLALDGQGRPLVAWGDARGRVQVRHWDGSQWRHLADDLSLAPGATTSSPQIAFDGQRVVVALLEYPGNRARAVLMRSPLNTPAWSGGAVDGVQLEGGGLISLALDAAGQGLLAHVSGSGLAGELAPRVVQEGPSGWAAHCDGGVGPDPGQTYVATQLGFGLQAAPGGGSLLVRVRNDAQAVQAWRCNGSGAWALDGPAGGGLVTVDNVLTYLHAVATGRSGPPTVAVLVGNGYSGGSELHAFAYGAFGFQAVGPPLTVDRRGLLGTLAVASAAPGSPVAAFGVEPVPGDRALRAARFHP